MRDDDLTQYVILKRWQFALYSGMFFVSGLLAGAGVLTLAVIR